MTTTDPATLELIRERLELEAEADAARPRTRGECQDGPRPCPFLTCRYHLAPEALHLAQRLYRHPDGRALAKDGPRGVATDNEILEELAQMKETCALDVADRGRQELVRVGEAIDCCRERSRQIETKSLIRFRARWRLLIGEDTPL